MVEVRISGWTKLKQNGNCNTNDFFTKYYLRNDNYDKSIWQYYHHTHPLTDKNDNISIPYETGLNSTPTYPTTASYACGALIKHYPWSKENMIDLDNDKHVLRKFESFLKCRHCPQIIKSENIRIKAIYNDKHILKQITHTQIEPHNNVGNIHD